MLEIFNGEEKLLLSVLGGCKVECLPSTAVGKGSDNILGFCVKIIIFFFVVDDKTEMPSR